MITDQFGNKGEYISKLTGDKCEAIDGTYDTNNCYFDMAVRSMGAVGSFGVPMHTFQQEQGTDKLGLPDEMRPMYISDDLLNKCDVDDLNTCYSNNNCKLNDSLSKYEYLNNIIDVNENTATELNNVVGAKTYWNIKRNELKEVHDDGDKDFCDLSEVECTEYGENKYITGLNYDSDYFLSKPTEKICEYKDEDLSQNEWVNQQAQFCSGVRGDICDDNKFCSYEENKTEACYKVFKDKNKNKNDILNPNVDTNEHCTSKNYDDDGEKFTDRDYEFKWKQGEGYVKNEDNIFNNTDSYKLGKCSLDDQYNVKTGLNRNDEFLTRTLDDVLGDVNNGRVPDIDIFDNVTVTKTGDVVMKQDNQETAVKGLLEETNLSNLFFSKENTQVLHDTIRYDVYKRTNLVIDYQSENELYIVMRSILLQYGNFRTNQKKLVDEIQLLNRLVVDYCGKEVGSNVLQYKGYIKDIEQLPIPMDRPGYTDRDNRNTYDISRSDFAY